MTLDSSLWEYLRWPIAIGWIWWSLVWGLVTYYYLRASHTMHHSLNPKYTGGPLRLWLSGVWRTMSRGMMALRNGTWRSSVPPDNKPVHFTLSLQHGIVCGAMGSAVMGLTNSFADRSHFTVLELCMNGFFVTLSTLGGMMHLYAPMHRFYIQLWRVMVLISWIGVIGAYAVALGLWAFRM